MNFDSNSTLSNTCIATTAGAGGSKSVDNDGKEVTALLKDETSQQYGAVENGDATSTQEHVNKQPDDDETEQQTEDRRIAGKHIGLMIILNYIPFIGKKMAKSVKVAIFLASDQIYADFYFFFSNYWRVTNIST